MNHTFAIRLLAVALLLAAGSPQAQSTSFTYQGQLRQSGQPFTGMADLEFRLYDQLAAGNQIGSSQSLSAIPVEDGLFQVELDFGAGVFDGSDRYLEVTVDGAPLLPRQKVTATPYALLAAGLASGAVDGASVDSTEIQLRVVGTCPAGRYVREIDQDGGVVCGVDAGAGSSGSVTQIDTGTGLAGGPITETGTISVAPGGIGTSQIDSSQVQRRVFGSCAPGSSIWGIAPDGNVGCTPDAVGNDWRLGGNAGTDPANDFLGTTDAVPFEIRSGNARGLRIEPSAILFDGLPITANIIAGSSANEIAAGVRGATIAGGGVPENANDPDVSFERPNRVNGHYGTVSGGYANTAATAATVGGGQDNEAAGAYSAVAGGIGNVASGVQGSIGGGELNVVSSPLGTIGGGSQNEAGVQSTIGGGKDNRALSPDSTIGGGTSNTVTAVIGTIGGGTSNIVSGSNGAISGGKENSASGSISSVGGGRENTAGGTASVVAGGRRNTASGHESMVPGGRANCAGGSFSWAGGRFAKVRPGTNSGNAGSGCLGIPTTETGAGDEGTFIWADSEYAAFISTAPNQFLIRAAGGLGLGTNAPATQLHVVKAINAPATPANHVALIENDAENTGSGPDVLALKSSAVTPNAATNYITFYNANDQAVGAIEGDGSGGISFTSGGADFAEWLPKRDAAEKIQPGDVVGWHAGGVSRDTRDAIRVMVVSTRPIIAGNAPPERQSGNWARVGFIGQVPVRVRGPVSAGDWLVASGRGDGTAVGIGPAALAPGQFTQIIGQALTSADNDNTHLINVAVGLGAHNALGDTMARLQNRNARLEARLARVEARHEARLNAIQRQQEQQMTAMRRELALLREIFSPRVAQAAQ